MSEQKTRQPVRENKNSGQWVTLQEASEITGKTINALRMLVKRNKFDRIKKVKGKGHGYWLIKRDSLEKEVSSDLSKDVTSQVKRSDQPTQPLTVPFERYEQERDRLMQGMMMYRYKYETLEQKMKLLPAPVETVTNELKRQEAELEKAQSIIQEKEAALGEMRAELAMARRPWWKKMFGFK